MQTGPSALLHIWHHTTRNAGGSFVLPDGCVDLIGFQPPDGAPRWKLSPLIDSTCRAEAPVGQRYAGYRLRPGTQVNSTALLGSVEALDLDETASVLERLDAAARLDARVSDALQAVAQELDLRGAQRQLGVSERSLQRLISGATGRPPLYWKRLARLRRAARALDTSNPLAFIAADQGFADQAHMNLEFGHWLGLTPAQVRQHQEVKRLLSDSGYG